MQVCHLFTYPLKGARSTHTDAAKIEVNGLAGDRQMMLVDPHGKFITQREHPGLAMLQVRADGASVQFTADGKGQFQAARPDGTNRINVTIWKSEVSASVAEENVNQLLSDWLARDVRLVFFDAASKRTANPDWAGDNAAIRFSDAYPILITTTGSLKALNADMTAHGEHTVGMERFRPNIVIDSEQAWAEDYWAAIEIAGVRLDLVKPCDRCIVTTQDQQTGSRSGASPMPAMRRIRLSVDPRVTGVLFGWNALPRGEGKISIGDPVTVVEDRSKGWALRS